MSHPPSTSLPGAGLWSQPGQGRFQAGKGPHEQDYSQTVPASHCHLLPTLGTVLGFCPLDPASGSSPQICGSAYIPGFLNASLSTQEYCVNHDHRPSSFPPHSPMQPSPRHSTSCPKGTSPSSLPQASLLSPCVTISQPPILPSL